MKQTRLSYILCTRWQEERQRQSLGRVERALWCKREGDGSHLRSGRDSEKTPKPLLSRTIDKRNYITVYVSIIYGRTGCLQPA